MKEAQVTITDIKKDIENKITDSEKRYWRVHTSEGWISCWKKEIIETLKENIGKTFTVEYVVDARNENWRTIKGLKNGVKVEEKTPIYDVKKPSSRDAMMLTAYAEHCFNGDKIEETDPTKRMAIAISVIEQARMAFE